MRNLKGIKWLLMAITASSTVFAADLVIDNQSIPGNEISSITISPSTGNIYITTSTGYVVTPVDVTPPPPDAVAITSFTASPMEFEEGQSTLVNWQTQNADTCEAIGSAGNWAATSVPLNGSKSVTIATAGSYVLTLQCTGASGTVQDQVTVIVTAPVIIPNDCDAPSLSGVITPWADFWNGTPFPGPVYSDEYATIPRNGYLAIQFNTGNVVDTGLLTTIETTASRGRRLGAISHCPGDFNVADACMETWGIGGEIYWSTQGYSKACQLQPNTTYYFNVTFTDGVDPASTQCDTANCITAIRHRNPQ